MNKTPRLSPTGIEYGDYAWNFASGCGNNIDGKCKAGNFNCWAYSIVQRFPDHYPNGFNPTVYPEALLSPLYLKKPSRILCAFMGDLFWDCPEFNPYTQNIRVNYPFGGVTTDSLKGHLYRVIRARPEHTFLFLTKQPQNLPQWSPFPSNVWLGVSACNASDAIEANKYIAKIQAKVKYLSIEPMQYWRLSAETIQGIISYYHWVILGAQTRPYRPPAIQDIRKIVEACDKADVKVFLKKNLWECLYTETWDDDVFWSNNKATLRQEIP